MTFSQSVKQELCHAKFHCPECGFLCTYMALSLCQRQSPEILYRSDRPEVVEFLAENLVEDIGVIATVTNPDLSAKGKNKVLLLTLEDKEDRQAFFKRYEIPMKNVLEKVKKACCRAAVLRGAFLSCGTIVDPAREYHLEFRFLDRGQADLFASFCEGFDLHFHRATRKETDILYLKESEHIEDLLTFMGAVKSAMNLMDVKIVKEVRNNVNRITNCETANIQKTVTASVKQVRDIELIRAGKGLSFLSEDLQKTAKARLKYPELSLGELCKVIDPNLSRSGLNHRLKRLSAIAEEMKKEK